MSFSKKMRSFYYNLFDLKKEESRAQKRLKKLASAGFSEERPVVTLTTVPKRIGELKPTLVSLLRQDLIPSKILVTLAKDRFSDGDIPDFLKGLSLVQIQMVEKDLGPSTKYLYTLQNLRADDLCVVVDDDMYYPADLTSTLVKRDREAQGTAVFCVNGFRVPHNLQSEACESDKEIRPGDYPGDKKRIAIVEGCGGYIMRKRFLGQTDLFDLTGAPERSHFNDDFWLSGHLSKNKIPKFQIALKGRRKSLVNTIESVAITGNLAKVRTELMNYFAKDWQEDEYI